MSQWQRRLVLAALTLNACGDAAESGLEDGLPSESSPKIESVQQLLEAPRSEYVQAPGGRLVHQSCVHTVKTGDGPDAVTDRGVAVRDLPPCRFVQLVSNDDEAVSTRGAASPNIVQPTIGGWIENTWGNVPNNTYYSTATEISGSWTVPPKPKSSGGTVFLFNGLEDSGPTSVIIQPVLQYGSNGQIGGNKWVIAGWYGGTMLGGNLFHSDPVDVNPGQKIGGYVWAADCRANGVCGTWWVQMTVDDNPYAVISMVIKGQITRPMTLALPGVLEAYHLDSCDQLPGGGGSVTFKDVKLYQPWGSTGYSDHHQTIFNGDCATAKTPCWNTMTRNLTPKCNYKVSATATTTTLQY
jgi:hypothetical protein